MFKVECPGCRASYQVDERRVPADGLSMRCPKCGTSFRVEQPGGSNADALGASLGFTAADTATSAPPAASAKSTQLGMGSGTAKPPAPARTQAGVGPGHNSLPGLELDLDDNVGGKGRSFPPSNAPGSPSGPPAPPTRSAPPAPLRPPAGPISDLPAVGHGRDAALPDIPKAGALPSLSKGELSGFGEIDLPSAGGGNLPAHTTGNLPESTGRTSELPSIAPAPPQRVSDGSGFGELDLPTGEMPSLAPGGTAGTEKPQFESTAAKPPGVAGTGSTSVPAGAPSEIERASGGGTAYGEVNLEGSGAPDPVGLEDDAAGPASTDDMEFQGIPTGSPDEAAKKPTTAAPGSEAAPSERTKNRRRLPFVVAGAVVLVMAGGALALAPDVGPFGSYWIIDQLRAGQYEDAVAETVSATQESLGRDAFPAAARASDQIDARRLEYSRVPAFAAYEAFVGFDRELRFGADEKVSARAKVLLNELRDAPEVPYVGLASAARAAAEGRLAKARQLLAPLERAQKDNIDVAVLRGETELRAEDPAAAVAAWTRAAEIDRMPRSVFGLARANALAGEGDTAAALTREVLKLNPKHVGAKLLLASLLLDQGENEAEAGQLLGEVLTAPTESSPRELVDAYTLMGRVHLVHSRISAAEEMLVKAIELDPKAPGALVGLGEALYISTRYSQALARYEAAIKAAPDYLPAKIGAAKAQVALERLGGARALLTKIIKDHPDDSTVLYWNGVVEEALGNSEKAEASYRKSIEVGGNRPGVVDSYIAVVNMLARRGQNDEAAALLDQARAELPETPAIHQALGDVALSQGRFEAAVDEFAKALELDSEHVGAQFRLGVTHRRLGNFELAVEHLDAVANVDANYPGLALERGLLFEASGRGEQALAEYEEALKNAPEDPDLMLRVGCARVAAGRGADAEKMLRDVLFQRPASAETQYCLGRAQLLSGTRLTDAQKSLERAAELDPYKPEYQLYVGWAANEAGHAVKAERALREALRLDKGLADAYWQRGVLRYRQGRPRDAVKDFQKALELRPSRTEARAGLASAYLDLGHQAQALEEWRRAVEARPDNAMWHFRYGKLLSTNGHLELAAIQLQDAIDLAKGGKPPPRWLWEAHRLLATALGARKEAIQHWLVFLKDGPADSPYRTEAKRALARLGEPWDGD